MSDKPRDWFPVANFGTERDLRIFRRLNETADHHTPAQRKRYLRYFARIHG